MPGTENMGSAPAPAAVTEPLTRTPGCGPSVPDRVGLRGEPAAWPSSGWGGTRPAGTRGASAHHSLPCCVGPSAPGGGGGRALRPAALPLRPPARPPAHGGPCGLRWLLAPTARLYSGRPAMLSSQPLSLSLLPCPPLPQSGNLACPQVPLFMSLPFLAPFTSALSLGMRWLTLKAGLKVRTHRSPRALRYAPCSPHPNPPSPPCVSVCPRPPVTQRPPPEPGCPSLLLGATPTPGSRPVFLSPHLGLPQTPPF